MESGSRVIDAPPAERSGGGDGGGWSWLLTAHGIIEAELVRGVLEAAGIVPVALDGRDPTPGAWMFLSGNVNALVRVLVPTSLLEAARLTLLEAGLQAPDPAPSLPQTTPAARSRRWVWIAFTVVVIAIFLVATMHARVA